MSKVLINIVILMLIVGFIVLYAILIKKDNELEGNNSNVHVKGPLPNNDEMSTNEMIGETIDQVIEDGTEYVEDVEEAACDFVGNITFGYVSC